MTSQKVVEVDLAIIGAGPAGLSAAIQAAAYGVKVVVFDENFRPGGQLFKQIHKFFGSAEHHAGVRGFDIGQSMLSQAERLGVDIHLGATVLGIYDGRVLSVIEAARHSMYRARCVVIATGATENALSFPGCTLPGVMGAGAAQTMINVNRVLPGKKVIMVGSGNVGLIVAYQLLQVGASVCCVVEAAPAVSGYGVHSAKLRRAGIPFLLSHTVKQVSGHETMESATLTQLDGNWSPVAGTERTVHADTLCLAVGLSPLVELAQMAGCGLTYSSVLGGRVPVHDENMATSVPGIYVAGDISGVEEASTAMEEGKLAGLSCAVRLGAISESAARPPRDEIWRRLNSLRSGIYGDGRKVAKQLLVSGFKG